MHRSGAHTCAASVTSDAMPHPSHTWRCVHHIHGITSNVTDAVWGAGWVMSMGDESDGQPFERAGDYPQKPATIHKKSRRDQLQKSRKPSIAWSPTLFVNGHPLIGEWMVAHSLCEWLPTFFANGHPLIFEWLPTHFVNGRPLIF